MVVKKIRRIVLLAAVLLGIPLILFSGYVETHVEYQAMMRLLLCLYCVGAPVVGNGIISTVRRKEKK